MFTIVALMRPLRALAIYIVVVFIGGALLAPWLYWLAQSFAHGFPKIASSPFHRFVNRAFLGLALLGIWPLLKSLGAASLGEAGLARPGEHWKKLGGGFLLGFVSLAVVAGLALASGARRLNPMEAPMVSMQPAITGVPGLKPVKRAVSAVTVPTTRSEGSGRGSLSTGISSASRNGWCHSFLRISNSRVVEAREWSMVNSPVKRATRYPPGTISLWAA